MTVPNDLWLPAPARARHDEPITAEAWERREKAKRKAAEHIAKLLREQPA